MAPKDLILEFSEYDLNHVIADIHEIRRYNMQRHEMEQLTAIVFADDKRTSASATRTSPTTNSGSAATCRTPR